MKRLAVLLLLACLLPLVGCIKTDVKPEPKDTNEDKGVSSWQEPPPRLSLLSRDDDTSYGATLSDYCWGLDEEGKPCKAYPDDPWDATMGNYTLRVATKTRVPVTFNNFSLPNPDEVIFRQYRYKDKVGENVEYVQNGVNFFDFISPEEAGVYYYVFYFKWDDEEVKGEAYYAMKLSVSER
ncbi:hypothetical protein ACFFIS_12505 [Virgibacillus soli]|uniref:hypothetical protein n=1 Tax=Paracerasibacillus soli TaxID=480284 RepID=UPI0035EF9356